MYFREWFVKTSVLVLNISINYPSKKAVKFWGTREINHMCEKTVKNTSQWKKILNDETFIRELGKKAIGGGVLVHWGCPGSFPFRDVEILLKTPYYRLSHPHIFLNDRGVCFAAYVTVKYLIDVYIPFINNSDSCKNDSVFFRKSWVDSAKPSLREEKSHTVIVIITTNYLTVQNYIHKIRAIIKNGRVVLFPQSQNHFQNLYKKFSKLTDVAISSQKEAMWRRFLMKTAGDYVITPNYKFSDTETLLVFQDLEIPRTIPNKTMKNEETRVLSARQIGDDGGEIHCMWLPLNATPSSWKSQWGENFTLADPATENNNWNLPIEYNAATARGFINNSVLFALFKALNHHQRPPPDNYLSPFEIAHHPQRMNRSSQTIKAQYVHLVLTNRAEYSESYKQWMKCWLKWGKTLRIVYLEDLSDSTLIFLEEFQTITDEFKKFDPTISRVLMQLILLYKFGGIVLGEPWISIVNPEIFMEDAEIVLLQTRAAAIHPKPLSTNFWCATPQNKSVRIILERFHTFLQSLPEKTSANASASDLVLEVLGCLVYSTIEADLDSRKVRVLEVSEWCDDSLYRPELPRLFCAGRFLGKGGVVRGGGESSSSSPPPPPQDPYPRTHLSRELLEIERIDVGMLARDSHAYFEDFFWNKMGEVQQNLQHIHFVYHILETNSIDGSTNALQNVRDNANHKFDIRLHQGFIPSLDQKPRTLRLGILRNLLATRMETDRELSDHILLLDTNITFKTETLTRMLETARSNKTACMVAANISSLGSEYYDVLAYNYGYYFRNREEFSKKMAEERRPTVSVASCFGGMALLHGDLFKLARWGQCPEALVSVFNINCEHYQWCRTLTGWGEILIDRLATGTYVRDWVERREELLSYLESDDACSF
jgi:hypothetical protein